MYFRAEENEEPEPEPVPRGPRRRRPVFTPQEQNTNNINDTLNNKKENIRTNNINEKPKMCGGLWTDDDIIELIKYVKKFPGGTQDRWEKIADAMNRTVNEVTYMAKKIKDEGLKPKQNSDDVQVDVQIKKVKTRAIDNDDNVTDWSQEQQKALESALIKYPKSGSADRWEKIASCIEGKTKV